MHKRLMVFFDVAALAGFVTYMAMTVWHLPEDLRHRLFTVSLGALARWTGMAG